MRLLRRLFRTDRALAAMLLLATFVVGDVADARHHLSERGCSADRGGRDDNCTCASLHVASLGSGLAMGAAPLGCDHEQALVVVALAARTRAACDASPRAPPRG